MSPEDEEVIRRACDAARLAPIIDREPMSPGEAALLSLQWANGTSPAEIEAWKNGDRPPNCLADLDRLDWPEVAPRRGALQYPPDPF